MSDLALCTKEIHVPVGQQQEMKVSGHDSKVGTHVLHGICALDKVTDLFDRSGLSEAVDSVQRLSFYRWIPARLNEMYASGCAKVETVARLEWRQAKVPWVCGGVETNASTEKRCGSRWVGKVGRWELTQPQHCREKPIRHCRIHCLRNPSVHRAADQKSLSHQPVET